jgi:hypothetical protein
MLVGWNVGPYQESPELETHAAHLKGVKVLRFMDWTQTNRLNAEYPQFKKFADIPTPDSDWQFRGGVWSKWRGVPLGVCLGLANRLRARAWVNVPDTLNVEETANFVGYCLTMTDKRPIIEFSNELWNSRMFHSWQALQRFGNNFDAVLRWQAWRTDAIVKAAHGRADVVLSGHARNVWVLKKLLEYATEKVDAIAVAPYMTGSNFWEACRWYEWLGQVEAHADLSAKHGVLLWAYEAGLHVEGAQAAGSNRSREAGTLYKLYFDELDKIGFSLVLPYSLASTYGQKAFGHYEISGAEWRQTPKLLAVMEYA